MEPETADIVAEEPPAPAEPPSEPPAPEPPAPETKRGRGRPPGSKNKPKITVVPLPTPPPPPPEPSPGEEADTEEAPAPKPKPKAQPKVVTKVVRMPEPPAITPHETFKMAMEALSHMARADKQSRQAKYDALLSREALETLADGRQGILDGAPHPLAAPLVLRQGLEHPRFDEATVLEHRHQGDLGPGVPSPVLPQSPPDVHRPPDFHKFRGL
jgi:hypothetical protein